MKNNTEESRRRLAQSHNDLEFAQQAYAENYYSQCCFISQQSAEKAVKAVHYGGGERFVTGHSIFKLLSTLQQKVSGDIIEKAKVLDKFYIAARYPNGLPGGAPYELFTQSQAKEALEYAHQVYAWAHNELQG